ncbi:hypothetical protein NP493_353g04026 [Ridgeia piscesae]|uniref:Macro domain-containing protein n=1 Tax=Ridgeia piscesae TaxID=27915 RepID=A0AAD9L3Z0_RIDPI|nr:hypothetical protein NP493_353g04026 [Ridgeia piscesae]
MADSLNVIVCDGDIVAERVDVIVSAANGHLANYSGVAGAISRAAGRAYERDCIDYVTKHGPLSVTAVVPMAVSGPLSCTYILHAVGPMWNLYVDKNRCSADLRRTFYNCLCAADDLGAVSMALPAVSTGIFHVPTDVCAQSLVAALQQFVSERANDRSLETVRIVNLSSEVTEMFAIVLEQLLSADGRTVSWVDSAAPAVAAEHSSRRRHSGHGFGDSDMPRSVGDKIVSSSDSSPGGTKSVTRRPVNGNVSAEEVLPEEVSMCPGRQGGRNI